MGRCPPLACKIGPSSAGSPRSLQRESHVLCISPRHQRSRERISPSHDGTDPNSWWAKDDEGNGSGLEISIGEQNDFVLMDSHGHQSMDALPVRNLADGDCNEYICSAPLLGKGCTPIDKACTSIDEWAANQYRPPCLHFARLRAGFFREKPWNK